MKGIVPVVGAKLALFRILIWARAHVLVALLFTLPISGCVLKRGGFGEPISASLGACNPSPCVKVSVTVPAEGLLGVPAPAEDKIYAAVRDVLYAPFDEAESERKAEALLKDVGRLFNDQLEEGVSDAPINWTLTRRAEILYQGQSIVSVLVGSEGYIGGAHGFSDLFLMSFDAKTGDRLTWSDCVKPESMVILTKVVEAEFRRARNIGQDRSLGDAGFFLSNGGAFELPANFALVSSGIRLRFNPYEVAPFSAGPTDVHIPAEVSSALLHSKKVDMTTLLSDSKTIP